MRTTGNISFTTLFRNLPTLTTQRLILRKMTLDDAQDMFEYAKDPAISRFTIWESHRSIEDSRRFLQCVMQNYEQNSPENWGIVYKENNRFIGTCGFFSLIPEHFRADIQYALAGNYGRQGIMTEAVNEVLRFGFETMNLNRVEADCMLENVASERVMQKVGMRYEGIKREGVFAKGTFRDLKVYAILKEEWRARRGGTL